MFHRQDLTIGKIQSDENHFLLVIIPLTIKIRDYDRELLNQ